MKQETVYEVAERLFPNKMEEYDIFLIGARWQMERSYSEEEVIDIAKQAYSMGRSNYTIKGFNAWFKQFKKK